MPNDKKPEPILLLSDARGIYIPHDFGQIIDRARVSGISRDDWSVLDLGPNPESDDYWEVWNDVLNDATVVDDRGHEYTLHQDGDLWLIPRGMEWNGKSGCFAWPEEESACS